MHESVVMSFAHPPVFMVGSIKTILEGISHLWTSRPQDQECHIEELLNNLLAWYRPTWTSQLQISVKTKWVDIPLSVFLSLFPRMKIKTVPEQAT